MDHDAQLFEDDNLFNELSQLIEQSKKQISYHANSVLTQLFWKIGHRIASHILDNQRAEYGKQIVVTLSTQLVNAYGRNFEERNLRRMIQFSETFADFGIVSTLSTQLSWSHFVTLLPLDSFEKQLFYADKIASEAWSVRVLRDQIKNKSYERASIANTQLPETHADSHNLFKDPYLLDFLNLRNDYLERDLEQAILDELEKFILELGKGFAFVERQKRMIIDGDDFYLDLLFYHRKLKRLVAIELKVDKFRASHKGQLELYLKWLNQHERQEGENAPIGIILCTEASKEQVELLEMHKDGIMVAEYWTELPQKKELEEKIHQALIEAKERLERKNLGSGSE